MLHSNVSQILNGASSHAAQGFVKATINNQLGFLLSLAYNQSQNPSNDAPKFDAAVAEAMGDSGLPEPKKYDMSEIVNGLACAFVNLADHINTPSPDNGRFDKHLLRFLQTPAQLVQQSVEFRLRRAIAEAKATTEQLWGKYKKEGEEWVLVNAKEVEEKAAPRINALQQEAKKQAEANIGPVSQSFIEALRKAKSMTYAERCDNAVEALTNADSMGVDQRVTRAAEAYIVSQRKRSDQGLFVRIDSGIYALSSMGRSEPSVGVALAAAKTKKGTKGKNQPTVQ